MEAVINLDFLREKITEKFGTIQDFAQKIGVSRIAVSNWLNNKAAPEEFRFLDIVDSLGLSEQDVDRLMGVPETQIVFRKTGLEASNLDVQKKSRELAETFFKIDGSSYVVKESFLSGTNQSDIKTVAAYIRSLMHIDRDDPVKLSDVLMEMKKHNINVFFMPLQKIGIAISSSNREVAFTARKGQRVIIFVDTNRTLDEANFDICHELTHLIQNHATTEVEQEKFCNGVAQELVYPSEFFEANKAVLEVFLDASKYSWQSVVEVYLSLRRDFDWSPKGLALSLRDYGLIKTNSHEMRRLMALNKKLSTSAKTVDEIFFKRFNTDNYSELKNFFESKILQDKDIFKPFFELKDASCCGRISPRKLAEILNIDSGDADELVRSWNSDQDIEESQGDDVSTTG